MQGEDKFAVGPHLQVVDAPDLAVDLFPEDPSFKGDIEAGTLRRRGFHPTGQAFPAHAVFGNAGEVNFFVKKMLYCCIQAWLCNLRFHFS